jgi:hypothetical protein
VADTAYIGSTDKYLYVLDLERRVVKRKHQLPDAITNALAYNAETGDFYAPTCVNQLFALAQV